MTLFTTPMDLSTYGSGPWRVAVGAGVITPRVSYAVYGPYPHVVISNTFTLDSGNAIETFAAPHGAVYESLVASQSFENRGQVIQHDTVFAISLPGGGNMTNAGTVINETYPTISMNFGTVFNNLATGLVLNHSDFPALYFGQRNGIVLNAGELRSGAAPNVVASNIPAVSMHGASLANFASGRIIAQAGVAVYSRGPASTVSNAGLIEGTAVQAIYLRADDTSLGSAGTVFNHAGGTIDGVVEIYGLGTVSNAGVISSIRSPSRAVRPANAAVLMEGGGLVANVAGGTITSLLSQAIAISGRAGIVNNVGLIQAGTGFRAIDFGAGGTLTNFAGGTIRAAGANLVVFAGAGASVTNAGLLQSATTLGSALYFHAGASVTNLAGGLIDSNFRDIAVTGGTGVVLNAGTIRNSKIDNAAVAMKAGGTVANQPGGVIEAVFRGVDLYGGDGTVTNAGTISASAAAAFAVQLAAGRTNEVAVAPSAVFGGVVNGGNAPGAASVSTLRLEAGSGTLAGFGTDFINFNRIFFDPGAAWTVNGTAAALDGMQLVGLDVAAGLNAGPACALDIVDAHETLTGLVGGVLSLGGDAPMAFLIPQTVTVGQVHLASDGAAGTRLTIACLAEGTRILTAHGEIAVERLEPGMLLPTLDGRLAPVVWIGHRRLFAASHPTPDAIHPILIEPNAFAPGVPHRTLRLSPDHAVFSDGVLVPAHALVNGRSIRRAPCDTIRYFHVELPQHAIMLAEGLAVETYLDTGNRAAFANAEGPTDLHPDLSARRWDDAACAPLLLGGPRVAARRAALIERAGRTTTDPALRLLADGIDVRGERHGGRYIFRLERPSRNLRLVSRTHIPAEILPDSTDRRVLGVAVAAITAGEFIAGWHNPEGGLRWTDGNAVFASSARVIAVTLATGGTYWDDLVASPAHASQVARHRVVQARRSCTTNMLRCRHGLDPGHVGCGPSGQNAPERPPRPRVKIDRNSNKIALML